LGCFPVAVFFLLIEVIDRHEAAPPLEGLAEGGLAPNPLGLGVDVIRNPHTTAGFGSHGWLFSPVRGCGLPGQNRVTRGGGAE